MVLYALYWAETSKTVKLATLLGLKTSPAIAFSLSLVALASIKRHRHHHCYAFHWFPYIYIYNIIIYINIRALCIEGCFVGESPKEGLKRDCHHWSGKATPEIIIACLLYVGSGFGGGSPK